MNLISKFGLATILILVAVVISLLAVIFANSVNKNSNEPIPSLNLSNSQSLSSNDSNECKLMVNGDTHRSLMLTETNKWHTIRLVGSCSCQIRMLLVGGGGQRYSYGGGGSGGVLYRTIQLDPGRVINANVGRFNQQTIITMSTSTITTTYTAKSGQNGQWTSGVGSSGGDGYSGGGSGMYRKITDATLATTTTTTTTTTTSTPPATTTTTTTMTTDASTTTTTIFRSRNVSVHIDADYRDIEDEEGNRLGEHHRGIATSEYKGGSNGGDGEGERGGKGSGDDVTSFAFNSWKLSPGDPGQGYNGSYASSMLPMKGKVTEVEEVMYTTGLEVQVSYLSRLWEWDSVPQTVLLPQVMLF